MRNKLTVCKKMINDLENILYLFSKTVSKICRVGIIDRTGKNLLLLITYSSFPTTSIKWTIIKWDKPKNNKIDSFFGSFENAEKYNSDEHNRIK